MKTFDLIHAKVLHFSKSADKAELACKLARIIFNEKKIVFTNGCFDILHLGHIDYLANAADLGNSLIIGLNADASVKKIKGPNRPVNSEIARATTLAALSFVNMVVLFDEETPYKLIKFIKPDVLVKGSDYSVENIAGADFVNAKGGKVVTIEFIEGYSTSALIEKIKSL